MSSLDAPICELNIRMISSILNLVCPQCGGSMSGFQCRGMCGKDWLPEWNLSKPRRRSVSSKGSHAAEPLKR